MSKALQQLVADEVVVIGNGHSCADALKESIADHGELEDQSIAWVFLDDLFDRSPDPARVQDGSLSPREVMGQGTSR